MRVFVNLMNTIRRAGGFRHFLSSWVRSNFRLFWLALENIPGVRTVANRLNVTLLLRSCTRYVPRIPRYTLTHDYTSFNTLYDESNTTYARLLPRDPEYTANLPPVDEAASVFLRDEFTPESNRNVTVLISYYAQWFTHQFFNTAPNPLMANQPLGINLSQMYGSKPEIENEVRSGQDGLLRSTMRFGAEFPEIKEVDRIRFPMMPGEEMFEMPIERANMVPGFAAIHILFFRQHQHIAKELKKYTDKHHANEDWDDERLFQTTKVILAINVLRITMHDYVARAIQASHAKIYFDQHVKDSLVWRLFGPKYYPPCNTIQVEFNFMYRWHQFVPDAYKIVNKLPPINEKTKYDVDEYDTYEIGFPEKGFLDDSWNSVAHCCKDEDALERVLFSAATQRAGKLGLQNTHKWLVNHVVRPGIEKNRKYELQSYNAYREYFGYGRVKNFEQITSDVKLQQKLKDVYGHVDNIEYYPGVFAEDKDFGGIHGPFLSRIGVAMTFGAIHASRLYESDLVNEKSLTKRGMELANEINYIEDLTRMHTKLGNARIRFTMPPDAKKPAAPSSSVRGVTSSSAVGGHAHAD